jgi:hypothetical protein
MKLRSLLLMLGLGFGLGLQAENPIEATSMPANGASHRMVAPTLPVAPAAAPQSAHLVPAEQAPVQHGMPTSTNRNTSLRQRLQGAMAQLAQLAPLANNGLQQAAKPSFFVRVANKLHKWMMKALAGDNIILALVLLIFFGGLAIHRVYLGTKPIMILWYFLTCGGLFGICPLLDLIVMVTNFDRLSNNNKFFSIAG